MFVFEALASGIQFAILALLLGVLMTAGFILPRGEPAEMRRTLVAASLPLLALFLLFALGSLLIQGAKLQGGVFPTLDILSRYLLKTQSGRIWLARETYALILWGILWTFRGQASVQRCRWLLLLSLPLVLTRSLTSHSVAVKESPSLALSADAIHLAATALWAGGLPVLSWALFQGLRRRGLNLSWAAELAQNFSRIALGSVAAILLTGIYQSWIHVQKLSLLWQTPYGRTLLLKLGLFACMLAFGTLNFFSTRQSLGNAANPERDRDTGARALFRISSEAFLGLSVLLTTGFLTTLPPGIHSLHLASPPRAPSPAAGREPQRSFLERLARFVVPSMATFAPAEGARVTLLSPREGETLKSDEAPIRYEFVKGNRGHHLHAYVDEQLMGMFSDPESGTLTGISPGRHTLVVRVVADDHVTELDASDRVEFTVE